MVRVELSGTAADLLLVFSSLLAPLRLVVAAKKLFLRLSFE